MMGQKMKAPCGDCVNGYCNMNCGPRIELAPPITLPPVIATPKMPKLPEGFKVICSVCGDPLEATVHFSKGQLKKKHPRCRACAPNKFSNQSTGGHQSRKESKRATYLQTLSNAGLIANLKEQVTFALLPAQYDASGKFLERALSYVADFTYVDEAGALHVEDAKGMRTDVYKIKRKLMYHFHKIRIEEV